jgi:5'-nucleotidase / UDP-sugar diphosphatase
LRRHFFFVSCIFLAFLLLGPAVYGEPVQIRILYMNDFHGFAEGYKPFGSNERTGGVAYLAKAAEDLRKERPSLFLAAGDMIQGSNWANLFQGKSVIELMNRMNFDAMTIGNHEFDFGQEALKERAKEASFPFLAANVEGLDAVRPYVIKTIEGVRVAIIGIMTDETPVLTHPKNVTGLKFLPPVETAERYVKELRNRAEVIVVLSHMGYHADLLLAERVKGIDVIVGGHSHTDLERAAEIGKTVIVQAWEHARALGVLDLRIEDGKVAGFKNRLMDVKPGQMKKDSAVSAIVDKYGKRVDDLLRVIIGETKVELDGTNTRARETNLGDLVADMVRQRSGAQIAIVNGGSIRASIKRGRISLEDVYDALPFDNYIVAFSLTGKQIRETLEYALSSIERGGGGFPQVSGLTFTYSQVPGAPASVKSVSVAGNPLDPDKLYAVATNDFLAAGGDGYPVFKDVLRSSKGYSAAGGSLRSQEILYSDPGTWLRDVVVDYIKAEKVISPKVEGRIIEIK